MSAHAPSAARTPIAAAVAIGLWSAPAPGAAADLVIQVMGAWPAKGAVRARAYDSPAEFLETPGARADAPVAPDGGARLVFRDLAPGEWAVAVYHDADGDGMIDRNFLGVPTERFGFSRDVGVLLGRPSFDSVRVTVPSEGAAISVRLGGVAG